MSSGVPDTTFAILMQNMPLVMGMAWVLAHDGWHGHDDDEWVKVEKAKIAAFVNERVRSIRGNRPVEQPFSVADCRLLMSSVLEECQRVLDAGG